jgi:hypothetical protein
VVQCNTCQEEAELGYRLDVLDISVDQLDGTVEAFLNAIAETSCCAHEEAQYDFNDSVLDDDVYDHIAAHQEEGDNYEVEASATEMDLSWPIGGKMRYTVLCRVACSCGEDFDVYLEGKFEARKLT